MPKKKQHNGPNSVGDHANAAASTIPPLQSPQAPAPTMMIVAPVRVPRINIALNGQVIGTIAVSRVPSVGEFVRVHVGTAHRAFSVHRVVHFPPEPTLNGYVDAEIQVGEVPA